MAGSTSRKAFDDVEIDISNQENVSQRATAPRRSSKQQTRHRASVACASCRDRRIRCVVPKGQSECTQCRRSGTECVIKNDDERRRPISKAYMSSLSARINMLEDMLLEKGVVPPAAVHPPKTKQEALITGPGEGSRRTASVAGQLTSLSDHNDSLNSPIRDVPSPPDSHEDYAVHESPIEDFVNVENVPMETMPREVSPFRMLDAKQEDTIHRLFATEGSLTFDQISGRLRFFGPTANSHVYAESPDKYDSREPPEQIRRAERIIRSLTPETHDYLMQSFWEYYNGPLQVLDKEAFEMDRESQNPKFYSSLLHITILAGGWRFADKDRDDMRRLDLGNRESTLHREAKYMLDVELERPGGIPSVQALLILGDLETGVGRDNTGWMYSGMANRLAFDVGLHLDCSNNGLPEHEVRIRQMVMRACILYDKYWALFLGRPTSIKSQDVGMDLLSKRFSSTLRSLGSEPEPSKPTNTKAAEEEIHDQLMELMDLAGRITEIREHKAKSRYAVDHANMFAISEAEDNAYMHVISLDRQLQNWYRRLPDHLTWNPANIKNAVFSYFLLHQQYHVTMILLHRQWARYGSNSTNGSSPASHPSPEEPKHFADPYHQDGSCAGGPALGLGDPSSIVEDSRTSLSRSICTQQAIRIARVFWQAKQKYDLKKICCTGMQHAGTASIALIAAIAYHKTEADRRSYMGYLEVLADAIQDMSHPYHPAARMGDLVQAVLTQLRVDANQPLHSRAGSFTQGATGVKDASGSNWREPDPYTVTPARRGNADHSLPYGSNKRPRATPSRRASEFARPPPPFFLNHNQGMPNMVHNPSAMSAGLFSSFAEPPAAPFDLNSLRGSTIDVDSHDEQAAYGNRGGSDNYLLVAPSADGWSLHSVHAPDTHPQHQRPPASRDFSFHMSEWVTAPAAQTSTPTFHEPGVDDQDTAMSQSAPTLDPSLNPNLDSKGNKTEHPDNLEWMAGDGGLPALSPISLSGLDPSSQKGATNGDGKASASTPRNHELDFFSF
ncbi:fungal-specific transcription factor domain-containing protein [Xylariaceae sp. FL1272]|nr:fungal-specific transcription factor domain-containing protein [Xylariaceae sp. FL1272]